MLHDSTPFTYKPCEIAFGDYSAPRPHLWRWRCHRPSRHYSLLPISAPSPLQCQSAILPQTWTVHLLSAFSSCIFMFERRKMKTSPFLFLGISGLQLIIHNHMIHLQKEQNSNICLWLSRVIKYAITLEKLTNSNLWVNLRRSHSRGFGWPLWVTVASTRNNLQIIISSCESSKPKMFLQSQLLAEYLSTRSNCSFSEISRVSTWKKSN